MAYIWVAIKFYALPSTSQAISPKLQATTHPIASYDEVNHSIHFTSTPKGIQLWESNNVVLFATVTMNEKSRNYYGKSLFSTRDLLISPAKLFE